MHTPRNVRAGVRKEGNNGSAQLLLCLTPITLSVHLNDLRRNKHYTKETVYGVLRLVYKALSNSQMKNSGCQVIANKI